ncbi:L-threonylcarbamoyladenylate synthase [Ruminococcus sp. FC2018]|uniref:L-threonylcarbamoyladenylate synthase n=1 Tax=Ruminococcus sp. FC2018 TaxID=1410617 RepID=UPI00048FB53D|nr:L-threonylcarbamoyladenylate synthase [Ruminococcus sp. FC2018]
MFETKILSADESSINEAVNLLKSGEVVGMPTETVYGLGADAMNENAVRKIFAAKGRPADNPLIVHISRFDMIEPLVTEIPELAYKCAEEFWPGPLTMIMPKSDAVPEITSGGLDSVGIRMPSHKVARAIINKCGFPIAAPSANLSGSPSPTTAGHVFNDMNGRIPAIVDGGFSAVGVESTVISFEKDAIRILRPGFISAEDLKEITPDVIIDKGVLGKLENGAVARSPGMKYKHYAPKADITIIDSSLGAYRTYVKEHADKDTVCMVFKTDDCEDLGFKTICYGSSDSEQAHLLFDTLRELDNIGAKKVFARCPNKDGIGLAVYNRLLRAAAFQVVKL